MNFHLRLAAVLFLGLSSPNLFAQGTAFEVNRNTKLHIQCPHAQVKLTGTAKPDLIVNSSSNKVTLRKDPVDDVIRLECESADPKMIISVQGMSVQTQLNVRTGSLSIQEWTQEVHSVLEKGNVVSRKTSGALKLFMTSGQMDIQNHTGRLKVETFNSKVSILNVEGITDVSNFSGSTTIKSIKGDVVLNSKSGTLDVVDVAGSVKYETDNGKLDLAQVNGSIEGESDQANVTIRLLNPVRLKAKVKNGIYKVLVPSSSGAQVYMAFEDGQYQVPSFLQQDNYGTTKTVRGTLRGGETGRVNLSGDSARVSLQTF